MAGAAFLEGEAEPLTRADDVLELSEGAQRSNRTPRWWAALGATLLAGAGAAVTVPRAGRPAAAPMGEKLVKLEALPTKAELHVTMLDFKAGEVSGGHPDFEPKNTHWDPDNSQKWWEGAQTGLVKQNIGSDGLPVWNDCEVNYEPCSIPDEDNFKKWWVKSHLSKEVTDVFELEEKDDESGVFEFGQHGFFPLDGKGWKDETPAGGRDKVDGANYYFTMQAVKSFVYHGGEYFEFDGDDDLWVFFNGYLGIDVGGMHVALKERVELDDIAEEAGLEKGKTVFLQIFFAERACCQSNFIIETNIQLQEDACFEYDRVLLSPDSAAAIHGVGAAHNSSLKWEGFSVTGGENEGSPVSFELVCPDDDCWYDQPDGGQEPSKHFPVVSLADGKSMSFDIKVEGKDGGEFDQEELFITFYELQDGMTIEAEGVSEYWILQDSDVEYTRDGTLDVFTSSAPVGTYPPEFPDELSEANKKMAVSLKFKTSHLASAKITLKNDGDEDALFRFTLTPMFECVPCYPTPCEGNEPFRGALTTTLKPTTVTTTTVEEEEEEYECCIFDKVGVKFGCQDHKPWYCPWCEGEAEMPWENWR